MELREKAAKVISVLSSTVIGHEDVAEALMLGVAAKRHVLIVGPPGTGKTLLVTTLSRLLQGKFYAVQLHRTLTPEELLGPPDINALLNGEFKRRWSSLIEADFVLFDEIFNASGATLNALLSLLQERAVYDPYTGQAMQARLWTAVGTSNFVPQDEELQALQDRFPIRTFTSYLGEKQLYHALQATWLKRPSADPIMTMDEVAALHKHALSLLERPDVVKMYWISVVPLLLELRQKEGVQISDRTIVGVGPLLFAAFATLYSLEEAASSAVFKITPYFARTPEELAVIRKKLDEMLGEAGELAKKLEAAREMAQKGNLEAAERLLQEIITADLSKIKAWFRPQAEAIIRTAKEYLQKISKAKQLLKE